MSIKQGSRIIAGSGGGVSNIDNLTITENANEEIQTVGVIDSNNTTNVIKVWTGTKAQYDALMPATARYAYTTSNSVLYYLLDNPAQIGSSVLDFESKPLDNTSIYEINGNNIKAKNKNSSFAWVGGNSYGTSSSSVWRFNTLDIEVGSSVTKTSNTITFGPKYPETNSIQPALYGVGNFITSAKVLSIDGDDIELQYNYQTATLNSSPQGSVIVSNTKYTITCARDSSQDICINLTRDTTQDIASRENGINSNTLYNITDDTDVSVTILEALYPVGSVYITTADTCPLTALISGSIWALVSSGRVLQGADSGHSAGTTIEAGLPNITGEYYFGSNSGVMGSDSVPSGAIKRGTQRSGTLTPAPGYTAYDLNFDASLSNSIYGNSSTVQPPAYVVNIYRRIA